MRTAPHTLGCALHLTCAHQWADITACVICGRTLEATRKHLDTCGEPCFCKLLAMQREGR